MRQPISRLPTQGPSRKKSLFFFYVGLVWLVSVLGFFFPEVRYFLALIPRDSSGLLGIITMPLVHNDWEHLFSNTFPFIVFSWVILVKGSRYYNWSVIFSVFLTGLLLWFFGRGSAHIGASGLVFSLFGLILVNAWLTRHIKDVVLAIMVFVLYGGLVFGLLPSDASISWEAHIFGILVGGVAAYLGEKYRIAR
ncbi:MAG: rhomboid family intramembrane serine protease [Pseudomonadales bacterium]|nr:rhomboid family intramembrane serine protease [Pseudomonadales bacterium]